jgi:hypothetical protein
VTEEYLRQVVEEAVERSFKRQEQDCKPASCPLPRWIAPQHIGHGAGMVRDLGHGDVDRGIERIREDHRLLGEAKDFWQQNQDALRKTFVRAQSRSRAESMIFWAGVTAGISAITGGLLLALWQGIKTLIGQS